MGDLIKKVGNYEMILNEMDEKENASKRTYMLGKNMTVGELTIKPPTYDSYYQRPEETHTEQDHENI